jgi:hypothetical protein
MDWSRALLKQLAPRGAKAPPKVDAAGNANILAAAGAGAQNKPPVAAGAATPLPPIPPRLPNKLPPPTGAANIPAAAGANARPTPAPKLQALVAAIEPKAKGLGKADVEGGNVQLPNKLAAVAVATGKAAAAPNMLAEALPTEP